MSLPLAVQLYTLRDEIDADFIGTLEKVAEIGYRGVEFAGGENFAGFGGMAAPEMKSILDGLGLKAVSCHTDVEDLGDNIDKIIEYNLIIGSKFITCPWAKYESKDDYLRNAQIFNTAGKKMQRKGYSILLSQSCPGI